jgi:hypothetical protein
MEGTATKDAKRWLKSSALKLAKARQRVQRAEPSLVRANELLGERSSVAKALPMQNSD